LGKLSTSEQVISDDSNFMHLGLVQPKHPIEQLRPPAKYAIEGPPEMYSIREGISFNTDIDDLLIVSENMRIH